MLLLFVFSLQGKRDFRQPFIVCFPQLNLCFLCEAIYLEDFYIIKSLFVVRSVGYLSLYLARGGRGTVRLVSVFYKQEDSICDTPATVRS